MCPCTRWFAALYADDWPGMWWVKPRGRLGPPLALSVLPAAGPEEPALQLTLAEKHTSPVAQHNYFHMFVPPGRSQEQSPLFWKQKTLISETKTEAFRNSAGYLDRCFSLESFKCTEVSKRLATNTRNYAGLIRLAVVRYCLLKMYALKVF